MLDPYEIRKDFLVLREVIYLDSAATSQTPIPVIEAMNEYYYKYAGNYGRGAHRLARETTNNYEEAREKVANFLGADPKSTIFTRNTTESIGMVAHGLDWKKGDHIVTTLIEHHSNLLPWIRLRRKGVRISIVKPDKAGNIKPEDIEAAMNEETRLVAVTHVSNVFGSLLDVKNITTLAHKHGAKVLLDAAQSVGHIPVSVKNIGCDFLAASGHKGLLGPQGTGILYIKEPEEIEPLHLGGGNVNSVTLESYGLEPPPNRFEAGTPNIPGVIGLGRGVKYVENTGVAQIEKHIRGLAKEAARRLAGIPGVEVYGPENRVGIVPFNIKGLNPHDVAIILDETKKICVRSGHHCAMPSIDFLGKEGTVRASFALYNTKEEVDILVEAVEEIARTLG